MRILCPLVLLSAALLASPSRAANREIPRPVALPGGFLDPSGRVAILSTPGGGIQAVELATGKAFWQTAEVDCPLFVRGDRLYALAAVHAPVFRTFFIEWAPPSELPRGGFRLRVFDLANFGACVLESPPVALPDWASLRESHDRSCALRWHADGGRLVVAWEAKAWYGGRYRPTPQEEAAARRHAEGAARFDLDGGAVEVVPPLPAPPPAQPQPVSELEKLALRWQAVVGNEFKALVLEEAQGEETLVLRSWQLPAYRPLLARELLHGKRLLVQPALDGRFLCLRDQLPSLDRQVSDDEARCYQWAFFAVDDGELVGRAPFLPGTQAVALHEGRAYFLTAERVVGPLDRPFVLPRSLKAVDLRTGRLLWERPVAGKPLAPPYQVPPTPAKAARK